MASITHTKEQVRDGYLNDLPEKIRTQIMDIHKMIKAQVDEFIDLPVYDDLTKSRWAMSCIDEFLTMPKDKTDIGSFRVFKNGKQFKVMVQVTGHFTNHQYGWIEELLHDFICNVYSATRPQIRKKYDMALINEGRTGSAYEGFDAYLPMKICKDVWDSLDDRKTKTIKESTDESDTDDYLDEKSHGSLKYSFRLGLNADNGHLIKVVFDLKPEDVTVVGSHDDTNPVDDDKWDSIKKGIRKTGYNDFASIAIVKAIVDMDTHQQLQTVKLSGILNGNQQLAEKPLKEREKIVSDSKTYGGIRGTVFTVGEEEPVDTYTKKVNDRYGEKISGGTYKMTKGFNNMDQFLRNVNNPSMGRGEKIEDAKDGYRHYRDTTTFKHPSKKEIKRQPQLYQRESKEHIDRINGSDDSLIYDVSYEHWYQQSINEYNSIVLEYGTLLDYYTELTMSDVAQKAKKTVVTGAKVVKDAAMKLWKSICACAKYIASIVKRMWNTHKAKQQMDIAEELKQETDGNPIDLVDIPGDVYDDMFESVIYTEDAAVVANVLSAFCKGIVDNKGLIVNLALPFIPGGNVIQVAKISIIVGKMLAKIVPLAGDIIATSREIALLKKKYAGKMRKIKDESGNIVYELPAESYITIDKYKDLINRFIHSFGGGQIKGAKNSTMKFEIGNTDDLLKFWSAIENTMNDSYTLDDTVKEYLNDGRKRYDTYCQEIDSLKALIDSNPDSPYADQLREEYQTAIEQIHKEESKSVSDMSGYGWILRFIGITVNAVNLVMRIYDSDGVEYRCKGQSFDNFFTQILNMLMHLDMKLYHDYNELKRSGDLSLKCASKVIKRFAATTSSSIKNDISTTIMSINDVSMVSSTGKRLELTNTIPELNRELQSTITSINHMDQMIQNLSDKGINDTAREMVPKIKEEFNNILQAETGKKLSVGLKSLRKLATSAGSVCPSLRKYTRIIDTTASTLQKLNNDGTLDHFAIPSTTSDNGTTTKHPNNANPMARSNDDVNRLLNRSKLAQRKFAMAGESAYVIDHIIDQSFSEATGYDHIYKDMDNKDAKKVLNILSNSIMKEYQKSKKDIDQYNASIYANTITKKLLNDWAGGFRRLTITLKDYGDRDILEFKVPKMTQDFVSRFIVGRESINGFLHRQPEIKIVMSPTIFRHMKDPDDPYKFFKAAVKYYDEKIHIYSQKLMAETMRLDHTMKYLIGTTSLSGLVTYPMKLLFVFNDMDISDPKSFTISDEDLNVVRKFIRSISSRYAAPEKEKRAVVNDIKDLVASLRESCDPNDETMKDLDHFHEAAEDWLINHKYDTMISDEKSKWEYDQIDYEATRSKDDPQAHYLREAWGVKKLKKIPRDLVAYIQIETEAIRDSNDKMMIASYCLSKLEIVEWYIELIDVGSKKYIVPHPRPYLETIRTQLLACFDKIMKAPVNNNKNKPVIPNVDDL